jgi:ABC-type uncharacterized transport system substrate-binding protein
MRRRDFIRIIAGSAASAWPLTASAQKTALPVIGFLNSGSPRSFARLTAAYREGLQTQGLVHGRDIWIDYRWAEGHYADLPALAADLVRRGVAVITATGGTISAQAARAATSTIPIVFVVGFDPVQQGLVASLNKPGGNATGVSIFTTELATKRLELLHELLPAIHTVTILVNPGSAATAIEIGEINSAADKLALKLVTINAKSESDIDAAYASAVGHKAGAVLVSADPFFMSRRAQLVNLAARYTLPTMYPLSAYAIAGGLFSYGPELAWAYRQAGVYTGRILKGAKPTDLPIMLPTDFNLVINMKTAKTLGLSIPSALLARADEVIE